MLDQSEVDSLLAAVETPSADAGALDLDVQEYDFRRPERVGKDQMRALQTLHDAFARNLGAALSGFLRTIVEIKQSSCDQMTYSEFTSGLPNPTSFNLFSADPLEGQMCLEISPLIVYPIIDRLLGGSSQDLFVPQRPLTQIEAGLISKITSRAMDALKEAWAGVREINFKIGEMESNPQLVQIVPPNEVVVVVGFEVRMGTRAGTMNLCIPFNVIEPVVADLASQNWFLSDRAGDRETFARQVRTHLNPAPLAANVVLAETTISVSDLMNLAVGDVIMTDTEFTEPCQLRVEGQPKMLAHVGQHRGKRAIRVVSEIERPAPIVPEASPGSQAAA